jgi:hypothetical protein
VNIKWMGWGFAFAGHFFIRLSDELWFVGPVAIKWRKPAPSRKKGARDG